MGIANESAGLTGQTAERCVWQGCVAAQPSASVHTLLASATVFISAGYPRVGPASNLLKLSPCYKLISEHSVAPLRCHLPEQLRGEFIEVFPPIDPGVPALTLLEDHFETV